jgi:hypothetical protein
MRKRDVSQFLQDATKNYKLRGLGPWANYTDRATPACRRSQCHILRIERCHVLSATDPHGRILGFLDQKALNIKFNFLTNSSWWRGHGSFFQNNSVRSRFTQTQQYWHIWVSYNKKLKFYSFAFYSQLSSASTDTTKEVKKKRTEMRTLPQI